MASRSLSDHLRKRNDLATMTGDGSSWCAFPNHSDPAAPLLSALIRAATV
jgi:hypothetical protein